VKCTHGATIGQIEENALFYLRSRGIDETSARRLLLLAFASECLDRMKEGAARTHVESLISAHLATMTKASAAFVGASEPSATAKDQNWGELG
jgi:Fe-S cluster assembly protein SufD